MKKLFILTMVIALALSACDAIGSPTEAPAQPTAVPPTAEVIVVTVEVPVEVTAEQPPTAVPTAVPADTQAPTPVPPTAAPPTAAPPTEVPPTEAAAPAASAPTGGATTVDSSFWGGFFKDITYSSPSFSLRCQPKEITITATAANPYIVDVDMYYRIEDRQGTFITEWKNTGKMKATGNGTFTKTFSGEDVHPDLRKALAWFDFQLVGLNKQADAVGRTEKIVQLVTYTIDCQ